MMAFVVDMYVRASYYSMRAPEARFTAKFFNLSRATSGTRSLRRDVVEDWTLFRSFRPAVLLNHFSVGVGGWGPVLGRFSPHDGSIDLRVLSECFCQHHLVKDEVRPSEKHSSYLGVSHSVI